ncbi:MAG TPA: (2Fe-2S)-binding protein [Porphyromonadaceae bacterium]|jgi:hypothetical protein|nr:(2Fe-2S)-binding protein [Porphyromonadaceae bacterium]
MERDGHLESIWQSEVKHYGQKEISPTPNFDVVIAGAGITGITSAIMLQKNGVNCILVEAANMGFGTTGGTTAHLNNFFDKPYYQVIKEFGLDSAKLLAKAAREANDIIKDNINIYQIYCDYSIRNGYMFSLDENQDKELQKIIEGHHQVGIETFKTNVNPFGIPSVRVVEIPNQAQFHPLKYLRILLKEFIHNGGVYIEDCRIISVDKKNETLVATTNKGSIHSRYLIYATHIPPGRNIIHFRNTPYRSYVMAVKLKSGHYPEALGYDLFEPYHYYRTHNIDGEDFLIAGGEDHKTGYVDNASDCFERLESYLRRHFDIENIAYKWSSQFYEPADGLPYIGHLPGNPENVYFATGYSGTGMIFGTLAAKILNDVILKGNSIYEELFLTSRVKPVSGFNNIVKEAADKNNIIESDCTHLHCKVKWNQEEKSWDCPCHGSRFGIDGEVLTGPAVKKLKSLTEA